MALKGIFLAFSLILSIGSAPAIDRSFQDGTNLVVVGDTGKDNEGQASVARAMEDYCTLESCDLGVLVGDVVYQTGVKSLKDPILERMFDKHYNALNIPFLIALGNHDYGKLTLQWKRGYYQTRHMLKNPLFYLPHYYYTYETPHAVIAVLDTTRLMWMRSYYAQKSMVLAAQKRAQESGKWFIVSGHHTYLSNGKHGNAGFYEQFPLPFFASGRVVKKFFDRYVCGRAHFYLAGHDHSLQVMNGSQANCDTQLVVSGAGASATKLFVRNQAQYETTNLGFAHLSLYPSVARLRMVGEDAGVMFETTYLKTR